MVHHQPYQENAFLAESIFIGVVLGSKPQRRNNKSRGALSSLFPAALRFRHYGELKGSGRTPGPIGPPDVPGLPPSAFGGAGLAPGGKPIPVIKSRAWSGTGGYPPAGHCQGPWIFLCPIDRGRRFPGQYLALSPQVSEAQLPAKRMPAICIGIILPSRPFRSREVRIR